MGEVRITDEMVETARAKGRELAGNQPGALVEAMAEIAEQANHNIKTWVAANEPV